MTDSSKKQETIRLIFGLKLKQTRAEKGMTQAALSKQTGISVSYLNEIEKGKKYPKPDKIFALADALDLDYDTMVSLKLDKKLAPIAELINSNILHELPLDMFGISINNLFELLSNAPAQLSAFISTIIEIGRNYDMGVEHFYFSALRTYQEMHENYFPELEEQASEFLKAFNLENRPMIYCEDLEQVLKEKYKYQIDEALLPQKKVFKDIRSLVIPGSVPRLLLNDHLLESQRAFILGREIGYQFMKLEERTYSSMLHDIKSFDQVLNHFKASYFSSAILIRLHEFVRDLKETFMESFWDENMLLKLMLKYNSTPEMFLQRLTNVAPKFFGMHELFFLRFSHKDNTDLYHLTKEMHLSGLHNPHAIASNEHYCRRWISLSIFKELESLKKTKAYDRPLVRTQISDYVDSDNQYLIISMARAKGEGSEVNSSISVGFKLNENLKRKVKFSRDKDIPRKIVSETCERCPIADCKERVAEPIVLREKASAEALKDAIDELTGGQDLIN
ncbi:helix-turn-helix transcriptional regulator [Fulvivirgaceae bacterium BMA10]|uniref:Helix-turn-helix transcriptional regulator n=1 Tax=Splendidivirga corallicola TaxID=3051826 RepID=A0ABT8KM20_9BACT|nr:helix-turn-helix transcriptional regulator [Fulvivirgaceae bacterium BMA10]